MGRKNQGGRERNRIGLASGIRGWWLRYHSASKDAPGYTEGNLSRGTG